MDTQTQISEASADAVNREFLSELKDAIQSVIVGQDVLIDRLLTALLADGHVLLEGLPGLAKSLLVKSLSDSINASFSRIQFTPDLLPADLIGTMIYQPRSGEFDVHKGPIFAGVVLADEINRAPAKVQSALLEAMQERQVTIGDTSYPMDPLFLVLATQNPIEQEGTYPLPEAQLDRFMFKLLVGYPDRENERIVLDRMTDDVPPSVSPVIEPNAVLKARKEARAQYIDPRLKDYILDLVSASRKPAEYGLSDLTPLVNFGASPRAGIYLVNAAKAYAFIRGRSHVIPDDIKALAPDILRHRIILSFEAEAEAIRTDEIIDAILDGVEVP